MEISPASQNDNRQESPAAKALPASSLQEETLVTAREAALSKQYKIHFSRPGESIEGEVSFDAQGKVQHGPMIYARAPKLAELEALQEGGLHRVEPDSLDWLAIDEQGHYLDKAGHPCPDNDKTTAARLDAGQMREAALIRPATYYFSNPLEMAAEALALFREGPEQRRQLLKDSPGLYRFTKNQDQKDINEAYGLSKSGQALYLRLPSGHLAMSTKGRLDEIEKFEN